MKKRTQIDFVGDTIQVAISTLASSPTNPRKHFDAGKLAELAESITQHGVLQAVLVRPWPEEYPHSGEPPIYEIVAGERRYRAAQAAGLDMIPATILRIETPQVLEIQVIENLQREGLHELEEAEGYQEMMENHDYTADQIAEKIGKSRSYIFSRLKLLALDEKSRQHFREGRLNASTALLVARIPAIKNREKAIEEITEVAYNGNTMSFRKAQEHINNYYMSSIQGQDFQADDEDFSVGACTSCPNLSGNIPDFENEFTSAHVCTKIECLKQKTQEFFEREKADETENYTEKILVRDEEKPHNVQEVYEHEPFKPHQTIQKHDIKKHDIQEEEARRAAIFNRVLSKIINEGVPETVILAVLRREIADFIQLYDDEKTRCILRIAELSNEAEILIDIDNLDAIFTEKVKTLSLHQLFCIMTVNFCEEIDDLSPWGFRDRTPKLELLTELCGIEPTETISTPAEAGAGAELNALKNPENTDGEEAETATEGAAKAKKPRAKKPPAAVDELAAAAIESESKDDKSGPANAEPNKKPKGTKRKTELSTSEKTEIEMNEKPKAAYAHPENDALTWSGKGRKPGWVLVWLADGGTIEELKS